MRLRLPAMLLTLLALAGGIGPAHAQPLEQSVKAAFLPKFARYVAWPSHVRPTPGQPLVLCVIGNAPFAQLVERAAAGQRIDQNPIAVRRLSSTARASACHIAFVGGSGGQSTAQMLAALRQFPVLTVTDSKIGPERGMIHFAIQQGRVSFHIDEGAAGQSNLGMSSRLLALAISVRR